jgi:hypothetical protein
VAQGEVRSHSPSKSSSADPGYLIRDFSCHRAELDLPSTRQTESPGRKTQSPSAALPDRKCNTLSPAISEIIKDFLTWHVVVTSGSSILEAMAYESRYGLSFWDALIVQAANVAGAGVLYSEDMNSGQIYGQTKVLNPFL